MRALLAAGPLLALPWPARAGLPGTPSDTIPSAAAVREALSSARSAQSRFERLRRQWSPLARFPWSGTSCDEIVGRICLRYDEGGDWWPVAEDARITEARGELLDVLEEAARLGPQEPWILGQRVAYLGEAGLWEEAEAAALACLEALPSWCRSLLGLALHGQGRFAEAERAFRVALEDMDDRERRRWNDPAALLDGEGRRFLRDAREGAEDSPTEEEARERLWRLADPLYLSEGNDRLTEHWARVTVARIRENAANPYAMSWGRDLEEVLVRYGWEVGWERSPPRPGDPGLTISVIGHHHPESRGYVPPGAVLGAPASTEAGEWRLSGPRPREGHAPPYAPVVIPADGEILRFPRGERVTVVGVYGLPEDTTRHAAHGHPPFEPPKRHRGTPLQAGLFLLSVDGGEIAEARREEAPQGALLLDVPAGEYVASLEVWSPTQGFAGRLREGLDWPPLPPDVASLSGLILLDEPVPDSVRLEDVIGRVRAPGGVPSGGSVVVGWELHGLGWQPEVLSYRLSLLDGDRGVLRRLGEWLGVTRADEPQRLEWNEGAPLSPGPFFRSVAMEIPALDPGTYTLRLEVSTPGRSPLVSERSLLIVPR